MRSLIILILFIAGFFNIAFYIYRDYNLQHTEYNKEKTDYLSNSIIGLNAVIYIFSVLLLL